ncbi:MAG: 2-C-methyl-D-erythritol 4-phosphate cytidylyltransferase [Steroidobacteraceae bacterium]
MPAAGSGARFAAAVPKQYAQLEGRSVIEWSLQPFLDDPRCVLLVVAVAGSDEYWPPIASALQARGGAPLITVAGGEQRCHSVRNAVEVLNTHSLTDADWVLVHDAARPCLSRAELDHLLGALAAHPLGGLLAVPVADTIKLDDGQGGVAGTVDRKALWRALTPQMFRIGILREALDAAIARGSLPTDETQAVEEWALVGGGRAQLVPGAPDNLKITSPGDLALAAAILQRREAGKS